MALLEVRDVHVYYGNIHALRGISITVEAGEIVTLIGSNGVGKSTTLNTICGIAPARRGQVLLDGEDITHCPAHENLTVGAHTRSRDEIHDSLRRVYDLFPRLKERRAQPGGTLSGGEQQMLAIGRALMSKPRILLLDEPSMGLAPLLMQDIFATVKELNDAGTTILLVEQNAHLALSVCHRGYVLQTGEVILSGTGQELLTNEMVLKAYLGEN